jgi:orotate phosphoribosyltransferase
MSTREDLARRIYAAAYITGNFKLRSGAVSHEYFDKYLFETEPRLLADIGKALAALVPDDIEVLAGLEMGAIPIVTMIAQNTGHPTVFVRKQAKEYGTCKLAEGASIEGRRVLVIEDVVTSGGQVVMSTADLRAHGAIIDRALCVIDRQSGGKEKLAEVGVALTPLFTMSELKAAAK